MWSGAPYQGVHSGRWVDAMVIRVDAYEQEKSILNLKTPLCLLCVDQFSSQRYISLICRPIMSNPGTATLAEDDLFCFLPKQPHTNFKEKHYQVLNLFGRSNSWRLGNNLESQVPVAMK